MAHRLRLALWAAWGCVAAWPRLIDWSRPSHSFQRRRDGSPAPLLDRLSLAWAMVRARYWSSY